jgi:polysaccharide pyruvyl transferase WcaK-like protein
VSERVTASGRGPQILVYGLFGIGNTGNDATLEVTLAELTKCAPGARFTIVASVPERVEAEFGVECVPIRPEAQSRLRLPGPARRLASEWARWEQARALLRTADCLLVPGTGILDDFGATVMGHAYQLWRWCAAARRAGVPVKFVSVGAGPVERPWSRRLFRLAAGGADHRSYRDEGSLAFARDVLRLDTSGDRVTPDLAFGLEIDAPPLKGGVETVGVGVMDYHNWIPSDGKPDIYEPYMRKLSQFAADLLGQGKAVKVLVGDSGDLGAAADFRERLVRGAPERAAAITQAETPTLRALCAEVAKTDAVVATRYHTIVAALMCGRPAVSIGYAEKNRSVMQTFGAGEYCQNIEDFDVELLQRQFVSATGNCVRTSRELRAVASRLQSEVRAHFAGVAREIAKSVEKTS